MTAPTTATTVTPRHSPKDFLVRPAAVASEWTPFT